jgi:hypothetical protein
VYNLAAQTVLNGDPVTFDNNGAMTADIYHPAGTAMIFMFATGIYEVTFSVSGNAPNQVGLFDNGGLISGTTYGAGTGAAQNTGQAIVTITAGDVLTLENYSSTSALVLTNNIGGTGTNVNASVVIEQVG